MAVASPRHRSSPGPVGLRPDPAVRRGHAGRLGAVPGRDPGARRPARLRARRWPSALAATTAFARALALLVLLLIWDQHQRGRPVRRRIGSRESRSPHSGAGRHVGCRGPQHHPLLRRSEPQAPSPSRGLKGPRVSPRRPSCPRCKAPSTRLQFSRPAAHISQDDGRTLNVARTQRGTR